MKKVLIVLVMGMLMFVLAAGMVSAEEGNATPASETQMASDNQQPTGNQGKVDITPSLPDAKDDPTKGGKVKLEYDENGVVKDATPWIKPMSIEQFEAWLLGIGYRILGSVTNVAYLVFAIVIVIGAIVMVLPSLHHHPVMKYAGLSMIIGGFFGYIIVLIYPLIMGVIRGTVNGA